MIDYQEIGNNIKICRIRCNLKQAELAAPEQVKLCLSVCKTIIEHGESHQFK